METVAFLGREATWGSGAVTLRRFDALQLAHRVRGDRLMEHGLLEDAADDGADLAARAGRVHWPCARRAVGQLDRPPGTLQAREERVELGDVALVQPELAKLGEDLLPQAVVVGVGC